MKILLKPVQLPPIKFIFRVNPSSLPENTPTTTPTAALSGITETLSDPKTQASITRAIEGGAGDALTNLQGVIKNLGASNEGTDNLFSTLTGLISTLAAKLGVNLDTTTNSTFSGASTEIGRNTTSGAPRASTNPVNIENPPGTLDWQTAARELSGVVEVTSSGVGSQEDGSSRAGNRTGLDGIRESTITGAKALQRGLGGGILLVTGGTEEGHAGGQMSHYNGYKLDYAPAPELIAYLGVRPGASVSRTLPNGQRVDVLHEGDHLDLKFYPA